MPAALAAIGGVIGSVAGAVASVIGPIAAGISATIGPIVASIGSVISSISASISSAVGGMWTSIKTAVTPLVESLKAGISSITKAIDAATAPILHPIRDALAVINAELKAVDAWIAVELKIVHDALEIASAAATVKLLVDLVKGTASVGDVIGKVAEGKGFETAVAIARLTKSIAELGVGVVQRFEEQWHYIESQFIHWDDQFKMQIEEAIALEKAEILGVLTPKVAVLSDASMVLNRNVAKLWRHIEDESWFAAMLLRVLR